MRSRNLVLIVLVFVLLIGMVSSLPQKICGIVDEQYCDQEGGFVVMRVSGLTNAHVELWDKTNYNYVLCCNFGSNNPADRLCDIDPNAVNGPIIWISSETNAHAEVSNVATVNPPGNVAHSLYQNYNYPICFSSLKCIDVTSLTCPSLYKIKMLSLSSETNAHVAKFNEVLYGVKICCSDVGGCTSDEECEELFGPGATCENGVCKRPTQTQENAYWANEAGILISEADLVVGETTVKMILNDDDLNFLNPPIFEIFKKKSWLSKVDIRTGVDAIKGTVTGGINKKATASWTITQEDLDKVDDYENFYFKVKGEESGYLELITGVTSDDCLSIFSCGDYLTEGECLDECEVAQNEYGCGEIVYENSEETCWYEIVCSCAWKDLTLSCDSEQEGLQYGTCDPYLPLSTGVCSSFDTTTDTCDDGFLTQSWEASMSWGEQIGNSYEECINIFAEYCVEYEGLYYYDPLGLSEDCTSGSQTIPCPAQIELPFFTFTSFILTFIIILLIHLIFKKNEI